MGNRGPQPKGRVRIEWSHDFAYAIGLLVTDGNLSPNGRNIVFTSKDLEQLENLMGALYIKVPVSHTFSGYSKRLIPRIQFSDILFYRFLLDIGLMPKKSKIIGAIQIPSDYFFDFLRGFFDGDGSIHSYWDKRWKSSFMFYTIFASGSKECILWLQNEISDRLGIRGHITGLNSESAVQLKYAKGDSLLLLRKMYPMKDVLCLSRKRLKIEHILGIVGQSLFEDKKS